MRTKPRLIHNATTKTHAPARAGRTSARSELKATPRSGAAPTPPHNPRSKTPSALPPPPPPPPPQNYARSVPDPAAPRRDPYQIRPRSAADRTRGPGTQADRITYRSAAAAVVVVVGCCCSGAAGGGGGEEEGSGAPASPLLPLDLRRG